MADDLPTTRRHALPMVKAIAKVTVVDGVLGVSTGDVAVLVDQEIVTARRRSRMLFLM
jgi:hypothetical protein